MHVPITTFMYTYLHLYTFIYINIHLFTFIYIFHFHLRYYVPRPGSRILHSRVDCRKHANMISYFPAEVRNILFFFIPWHESSPKHARFAAGKLQVIVTSYTENT